MGLTGLIGGAGTVAYSANFGGSEPIQSWDIPQHHIKTVLVTDREGPYPSCWRHVSRINWEDIASTPRRAARLIKLSPEILFPEATRSIWFDATHTPIVDFYELVNFTNYHDITCFRHPRRRTVAEEAQACIDQKLDDPDLINGMLAFFKSLGYADQNGLYGTACVIRQHTPQMAALNSLWREYILQWSVRDQISLPCVLWQLGMACGCLHGEPRPRAPVMGQPAQPNPYFSVTLWPDKESGK